MRNSTSAFLHSPSRLDLPLLLINLDRSPARLLQMVKQFEKYRIPYTRIQAVDGQDLQMDKINYHIVGSVSFNLPGAIGAVLSHLKSIQAAYNLGYERVVIMEDDIDISLLHKCRSGPSYTMICDNAPHDWEILQMHTSNMKVARQFYCLGGSNSNQYVPRDDQAWSSGTYIINRKGIENILRRHYNKEKDSFILHHPRGKLAPDRMIYHGAKSYLYTTPTVCTFDGKCDSTITPSKTDENGIASSRHFKRYVSLQRIKGYMPWLR